VLGDGLTLNELMAVLEAELGGDLLELFIAENIIFIKKLNFGGDISNFFVL